MLLRTFVLLVILIAILVGCLALVLPREQIVHLIIFRDFFDVSLPILAFGALVKYLCTCFPNCSKSACGCGNKNCPCCTPRG